MEYHTHWTLVERAMGRAVYENTSTGTERVGVRGLTSGATPAAFGAAAPYPAAESVPTPRG
ncbi:hypothetical protein DWB78_18395 [Halopelagius longus]|uniref:Uncharacterized protein n=1 Tax=Halopelagius longus TaxID=1236180 RepID=A0A1H1GHF8_9EURY|nr:hypothetical protein DWB78_18395 [Halopelagius longus]SDR12611.1 hypothetical protein SAMN05216278_3673 [Halopelagius longus]